LAAVISAGLAQGYFDLAENYEAGARANRADPTPFRKQVTASRSLSGAATLEFAENIKAFLAKDKEPNVVLACEFPTGIMAEPPGIRKVAKGMLMQDSEKELIESAMLQRGVLMAMSRMLGAPDDAAKTLELFKAGEPTVARGTFLYGTAKALYDLSALYGPQKLDLPNRLQMLCQEALDVLKTAPETKETKALTNRIQASLKKSKPIT